MPQITGYLDESERAELIVYARKFGLDGSGIANLLLVRELRVGRLAGLQTGLACVEVKGKRVKITAHQPDDSVFQVFRVRVQSLGMKAGSALSCLIRAELKEQWLEKAIEQR